jgi:serine phosphatase RsbU (regulator of sigma subunit)
MRQRTSLAILAALLGAGALWQWFPKHDRAADLARFRMSRREAVRKARSIVRVNGIDPTGWTAAAQIINARGAQNLYLWRFLHREHSVFNSLVTPFAAQVTLQPPDGERFVGVTFSPEGRLMGFGTATRLARGSEHMHTSETLDAQAEGVLSDYLGEQARLFRQVNRGVAQSHRVLYSWEYSDPADSPHLLRFEASFSEQRLVNAELIPEPADALRSEVRRLQAWQGYAASIMAAIVFIVISVAFPFFFRALVRQRLRPRRLITAGVMASVLGGLYLWGGPWLDQSRATAARDFTSLLDGLAGPAVGVVLLVFVIVLFYGAGRALLRPEHFARWRAVEALLDRRFLHRAVGTALLHGVLCGVGLAALPYLIAPLFPQTQAAATSVSSLYFPQAIGAVVGATMFSDIICIVLLVMPIVRWMRPRWLGFAAYVATVSIFWVIVRSPFDDWMTPGLVASALFATGIWLVESEYGALAAVVAGAAMVGTWTASAFWVQPIPALSQQGFWAAAPFGAMALTGAVIMRFGTAEDPAAEVEAMRAESTVEVRSQRERLAADFDVARRAQQAMLPEVPATLGPASFAASCFPARDVGGDLYDFYPTGDGRYALGVADVSGKGVPASLYMTLTKGFLAAAGRDSDDLLGTLSQLNSHLYLAGKRKIFVTMALMFYSPAERKIEFARAGHNSPLWRRTSLGRSEYLTPAGMGLGLTSRLLFERALRLQQIQLEPGDAFILYSDGITEAMNERREQFGEERLQAVVDGCDGQDARATEQAILRAVRAFIGTAPPHDDMTLFVVRV